MSNIVRTLVPPRVSPPRLRHPGLPPEVHEGLDLGVRSGVVADRDHRPRRPRAAASRRSAPGGAEPVAVTTGRRARGQARREAPIDSLFDELPAAANPERVNDESRRQGNDIDVI